MNRNWTFAHAFNDPVACADCGALLPQAYAGAFTICEHCLLADYQPFINTKFPAGTSVEKKIISMLRENYSGRYIAKQLGFKTHHRIYPLIRKLGVI